MRIMGKNKNLRAFTLIELLVVIAVIAVLVSMLLPALSSAREQGKRALCTTRLKTIHMAHVFYTEDNRDTYVDMYPYGDENKYPGYRRGAYWSRDIIGLIGGKQVWTSGFTYRPEWKVLNQYVDDVYENWHCPGDKGMVGMWDTKGESNYDRSGNSYSYNGYGNDYWDYYPTSFRPGPVKPCRGFAGRKVGRIPVPAQFVLQGDSVMHTFVSGHTTYQYAWHSKEQNMANMAFGDGHVEYLELTYDGIPGDQQEGYGYDFTIK